MFNPSVDLLGSVSASIDENLVDLFAGSVADLSASLVIRDYHVRRSGSHAILDHSV